MGCKQNYLSRKTFQQNTLQNQAINKKEIITLLFDNARPLENPQQEKNFHKAFDKLVKKTKRQWKNRRLPLPTLRLLGKALDLKINITQGLRAIAQKATNTEDLDLDVLDHLQYFDVITDNALEFIVQLGEDNGTEVSPDDAVEMISKVEIMQNYCREGIEHMLNQL